MHEPRLREEVTQQMQTLIERLFPHLGIGGHGLLERRSRSVLVSDHLHEHQTVLAVDGLRTGDAQTSQRLQVRELQRGQLDLPRTLGIRRDDVLDRPRAARLPELLHAHPLVVHAVVLGVTDDSEVRSTRRPTRGRSGRCPRSSRSTPCRSTTCRDSAITT